MRSLAIMVAVAMAAGCSEQPDDRVVNEYVQGVIANYYVPFAVIESCEPPGGNLLPEGANYPQCTEAPRCAVAQYATATQQTDREGRVLWEAAWQVEGEAQRIPLAWYAQQEGVSPGADDGALVRMQRSFPAFVLSDFRMTDSGDTVRDEMPLDASAERWVTGIVRVQTTDAMDRLLRCAAAAEFVERATGTELYLHARFRGRQVNTNGQLEWVWTPVGAWLDADADSPVRSRYRLDPPPQRRAGEQTLVRYRQ